MPIPEAVQIFTWLGAMVGSSAAAYYSQRSERRSRTVQTEVDGPGDEPSLRNMIKLSQQAAFDQYSTLNTNLVFISERLKMVEHSVNTGVEQRLQVLEKREQAADLVTATLKSIDGRVSGLVEEVTRAGFNIHELAGHVQIKLLTREEARLRTRMLDAQKEEPRP